MKNAIHATTHGKKATRYSRWHTSPTGMLHESVVTIWPSALGGWFVQFRTRHFGMLTYSRTTRRQYYDNKRVAFGAATGALQLNMAV